jgi:hypothetical protein
MPQEQSARNTLIQLKEVYFWTDTVKEWKHLLKQDRYKQISFDSWRGLIVSQLLTREYSGLWDIDRGTEVRKNLIFAKNTTWLYITY